MEPIFQAMNNTHNIVEEYLHDCKRSDNNISGNKKFEEIADQVAKLFKEMKLELNDNRKLRNNLRWKYLF